MGLAAPDDPVGDLELLLGRDLRGLLAPPPQANRSVFGEAVLHFFEESIVLAQLTLLYGCCESRDLSVFVSLVGPVHNGRAKS